MLAGPSFRNFLRAIASSSTVLQGTVLSHLMSRRNARRRRTRALDSLKLLGASGCLWLAGVAHAQDDSLARAALLLGRNEPATAYTALADQEVERAGDPRFEAMSQNVLNR